MLTEEQKNGEIKKGDKKIIYNENEHMRELIKEIVTSHQEDGYDKFEKISMFLREKNTKLDNFQYIHPEKAIKNVIKLNEPYKGYGLEITKEKGILFIKLPSGRRLAYCKPRMGINNFGTETVKYEGIGTNKKWELIDSYGPKFVENIIQAVARDILTEAMKRLDEKGFKIVMTVHDEVVLDVPNGVSSVEEVCAIMNENPSWFKDFPSACEGYECKFYKKE